MSAVPATANKESALRRLLASYRSAYAATDKFDDFNRELVYHYIARSSEAAAADYMVRGTDSQLAAEAREYATAAARSDELKAKAALANHVAKLLTGTGLIGLAAGLGSFFLGLATNTLQDAQAAGHEFGAGQGAVLLASGAVVVVIVRAIYYAAYGAAAAGKEVASWIQEAFASADPAKGILRELAAPEQQFFGGGLPTRALLARFVVGAAGTATAVLITIAVAVPLTIGGAALAGGVSGFQEGVNDAQSEVPEYTVPSLRVNGN